MATTQHSCIANALAPALSHRWKVLGVGVAANASFSAALAGIPTTAVWLRADYQLSNAQLGFLLGAIGFGIALSELPWGIMTDRLGERPVLIGGLLGTAGVLLAMATWLAPSAQGVPSFVWLTLAMSLTGLLGGSVNGSSGRAVMAWFAEGERGLAMSIRQTAVPMGGGIGALVLPYLAASSGFAMVYAVLAAGCALSAALAWRWLYQPPADSGSRRPAGATVPQISPLRDTQVWRVALGIGILCSPQFAVLTFGTVFLHDHAHAGIAGMTATMALLQVGAMVMRIWSGRYTDRHGNRRGFVRRATLVATTAFLVLAVTTRFAHAMPLLSAALLVAGICVSAWHGVAYTELATLAGGARAGTALGMANTLVYVGLFLVPLGIPHLLAATSWSAVWLLSAALALLAYPLFPQPGS